MSVTFIPLTKIIPFESHSHPVRQIIDKENWDSERLKDPQDYPANKPQRQGLNPALADAKNWGFFATNQQAWLDFSVVRLIPENWQVLKQRKVSFWSFFFLLVERMPLWKTLKLQWTKSNIYLITLLKYRTQQPRNLYCIKGHLPDPKEKKNKDILKSVPASFLTDPSQGL